MLWFFCVCTVPAFLISWSATWLMRAWAPRWGLVDQPAARKVHTTPTPLGGGVAIYLGVVLPLLIAQVLVWWQTHSPGTLIWMPEALREHMPGVLLRAGQVWAIVGAGSLLMAMGLLDDRYGLSWKGRLAVQLLLATALVCGGIRGTLFVSQPIVGGVLTVIWIVVLINSLNFLDNMDGLCGGIGLVASLIFAWIMLQLTGEPRWLVGGGLLILAGSIAGFLWHNWTPARIFMGDAGSTFIGLMLATMTILGTFYEPNVTERHVLLAPLLILAVPLYDFATVIGIRLWNGKSPFQPDRNHFSHRLTDLGLSRRNAVLTVHFATLTTGLGAVLLYHVEDWDGAMLVVSLVLCLLVIVAILEQAGRFKKKSG
ncbi:MraY family glycosyltransferase [Planctomicrobium piriforme]|uniref:UDP-GlcNAc:undecaprenyl-phosphate GlcNAc-1-phosphate transferase n=1 Tax=Planctomicrobium piriforme TaxID=1576369 RepID=A0A1I3HRY0_9PLAN|nr:MraY family glycosyltransferase [Planctomicrobium piriforme]SFI38528.1 UDP-GlcNAc:undecaprenyl-phosphate GlcNAc-1-phosphate transferase [Planctomicrobium piriforme]